MKIQKSAIAKTSILSLLFFTFLSISTISYAQEISSDPAVVSAGEALFNDNCTACHRVHSKLVGPALKGVEKRRKVEWIKAFIKNSSKVIASGDPIAVKLFEEFDEQQMNTHEFFSDDELMSLIAYIKAEGAKPPPAGPVEVNTVDDEGPAKSGNDNMTLLLVLIIALVVLIVVLMLIRGVLLNLAVRKEGLNEADQEVVDRKFNLIDFLRSKLVIGIVVVVGVVFVGKVTLDFVWGIGVQQGYTPDQPIDFSHRIHAGSEEDGGHGIDCNYCHTGVRKSKHANIPSANICMNCHGEIKKTSPKLEKLREAVASGEPIEWVRIHNLPDLAYFNHSQHVKVGGIECQKCHGPIETMDKVGQHADLTMGWCINCHRETKVNAKGNGYYDDLLKLHEKNSDEPMTVEDIGGLECAKCHY